MISYILMLLIIIFCVYREGNLHSYKRRKTNFIIALIPMFLLMAFKSPEIGADTSGYLATYELLGKYGMFDALEDYGYERLEVGYKFFIYYLSKICAIPQTLLIVVGFIVCYSLYKFIWINAQNKCLLLFLFVTMGFFQFAMSGIRQTIAISIALWSYQYVKERKLVYFLLLIFLSSLFHKSSVVFIPVYFVANQEITTKKVVVMFASMFVMLFFADKLLLFAADTMNYNYGIEETGNGYFFFSIVLLITLVVTNARKRLIQVKASNTMALNINFISLALWTLRLISRTTERVSLYFMPYTYLALEEYVSTIKVKNKRILYTFILVFLASILFIRRILSQDSLRDFKFFFQ